ncbi:uncharacterized protein BDZ99DRAFT_8476 [Mytilinidion resinicola]|uniref:Uncharacterized protein n=1 Tax=Mytilinidion resinicola TaxID=574789 RepID=A0A6A6Z7N7_9PEZI|nr:uncharacterized protein BDZ99DRAFT_8476 [Mytilinidion resinicola]KAF2817076.1 hypothetical protein BDZ99DRAFT_8476 [Mytilinidion resinicola]
MTLVWTCLTTIIACTWTILHLNVPHPTESTWTIIRRKAKWMIATILFPEFIFSKAICELHMAIDDLHGMKEKEDILKSLKGDRETGWTVKYGRGAQLLHYMFRVFGQEPVRHLPKNKPATRDAIEIKEPTPPAVSTSGPARYTTFADYSEAARTWTLTHSYFANMGGLLHVGPLHDGPSPSAPYFGFITRHRLDPITTLRLQHYNLGSTTHMPESYSPNISCREPS